MPRGGPLADRAPVQIDYRLVISKTAAVPDTGEEGQLLASHIHCAPAGQDGPVAVPLFTAAGGGVVTPTRVSGTITEASIGENDCGIGSLDELLEAMRAGETYVNVHTDAYPTGEIRGQIRAIGPP